MTNAAIRGIRRSRLRWIVLAASLASLAGLLLGQVGTGSAGATTNSGPKPTIVLVHGAWADGSSWSRVVARLQRDGYTVDVPPNTLRGLPDDPAYLADFLGTISGPIILAGHSYGGAVITNAATGNAQVKALVYVDAFLPAEGETLGQLAAAAPGSCIGGDPTQVFNVAPYPGAPAGAVDTYIKQALFPSCFANDLPPNQGAVLAATQRPFSTAALVEPSGPPAWASIPSWAVVGTIDRVIPPAGQLFMAERAHARITKVRASHLSMISHPDVVTGVIEAAAQSVH
jgi:pimeloyl-ACP methyl ester carboxylesterase